MRKEAAALMVAFSLIAHGAASPAEESNALRSIENGVLTSAANPAMAFTPLAEFAYVGRFEIVLKDIAKAERHHWVVSQEGEIEKLLILQFEGILDGKEGSYSFGIPETEAAGSNYKFSPSPISIGGVEFIHNTWAFNHTLNASDNPGMEAESTLALLEENDLGIDDGVIMSRFVQAFGDDSRHELIIFYIEPLSRSDKSLAEFPDGEPLTENYERFSDAVTARSLESFDINFSAE